MLNEGDKILGFWIYCKLRCTCASRETRLDTAFYRRDHRQWTFGGPIDATDSSLFQLMVYRKTYTSTYPMDLITDFINVFASSSPKECFLPWARLFIQRANELNALDLICVIWKAKRLNDWLVLLISYPSGLVLALLDVCQIRLGGSVGWFRNLRGLPPSRKPLRRSVRAFVDRY